MRIEPTLLRDLYVITPDAHEDARGAVFETFRADEFAKAGIEFPVAQCHSVHSKEANTVRGLNFQSDPPMGKYARVSRGKAFLVAVDIRTDSPTCGKWFGIIADDENHQGLYAPAGFARGIQTLLPDTVVEYLSSTTHNGAVRESAILWNDPTIGIEWPIKEMPAHTKEAPTLAEWLQSPSATKFQY